MMHFAELWTFPVTTDVQVRGFDNILGLINTDTALQSIHWICSSNTIHPSLGFPHISVFPKHVIMAPSHSHIWSWQTWGWDAQQPWVRANFTKLYWGKVLSSSVLAWPVLANSTELKQQKQGCRGSPSRGKEQAGQPPNLEVCNTHLLTSPSAWDHHPCCGNEAKNNSLLLFTPPIQAPVRALVGFSASLSPNTAAWLHRGKKGERVPLPPSQVTD